MAEETQHDNVSIASLQQWRRDIRESLRYARMRFGDVVWDYQEGDQLKKIWGHKGMASPYLLLFHRHKNSLPISNDFGTRPT